MNKRITSLTVRDFRSIRGSVTVPMDAPIVLVHGKNGAGKTSLLSGMELALTGQLSSLERMDANLLRHLIHRGAENAFVAASIRGFEGAISAAEFRIDSYGPTGTALLNPQLARHYSERCYLSQSTLGRLLEIYQPKDVVAAASPLTRFVKELLGLDALDALIDGLYDAGDVRRLRGGASLYWEVRDRLPNVQQEMDRLARESTDTEDQARELLSITQDLFKLHWPTETSLPPNEWIKLLAQRTYDIDLQSTVKVKHEITALIEQWYGREDSPSNNALLETAEANAAEADRELQAWLQTVGKELTDVFTELAAYFPDLPAPLTNRPEYARVTAITAVNAEIRRCEQALEQDAIANRGATDAETDRQLLQERLVAFDEQIALHSLQAGQLAQALSALLPHVHSDECPVCNRSFAEVSTTPLAEHLANNVLSLTAAAGSLAQLSKERSETITRLTTNERELSGAIARQLTAELKQELGSRLSKLGAQLQILERLGLESENGEAIFNAAAVTAQRLAGVRANDQRAMSIRRNADNFAKDLKIESIGALEPLGAGLQRFHAQAVELESSLTAKNNALRQAEATLRELDLKRRAIQDIEQRRKELSETFKALTQRKLAAERVIDQAKDLTKIAQMERTEIVRRVFNKSLNATWKDLFIRLAPDEPFVPAFALPESTKGAVEATLETVHRDGGKGGNPRAMLSAGNLNTAALTLFMALHLSAKSHLPWLIIDDPVQNMDEVHISQFAALLRAVSKQHERQVIIAVHEKQLFDYLSLELSPSFAGDSLITIELDRAENGNSAANAKLIKWEPDTALAA